MRIHCPLTKRGESMQTEQTEELAPDTRFADELTRQMEAHSDPTLQAGGLPHGGAPAIPHIVSFSSLIGGVARTYQPADQAIRDSLDNARFMENDLGIWSALEQRMRLMALLPWHLEPEDPKDHNQLDLCNKLTMLLNRIPRFTAMRYSLQDALWRGKSAVQFKWRKQRCGGREYILPSKALDEEDWGWLPINGDKLVFKYDTENTTDEGFPQYGQGGEVLGPVGVLANIAQCGESMRPYMMPTQQGFAYFPPPWARSLLCIHKHEIKDSSFHNAMDSGAIHGIGIRSKLYWTWFQQQELTALMMSFAQRSALGLEIWEYPLGNKEAELAVSRHAMNRSSSADNVILFPKPQGGDGSLFDVRHVEPGLGGLQAIQGLLEGYFGKRMLIHILGQELSTQAGSTGLGSGLADLHLDTLMAIVAYDAINHEETMTHELLRWLILYNFPSAADVHVRFVIDTKTNDSEKIMGGYMQAYQMGLAIDAADVRKLIGGSMPTKSSVILQQPSGGGGAPGMDGGPGDEQQQQQGSGPFSKPMHGQTSPLANQMAKRIQNALSN